MPLPPLVPSRRNLLPLLALPVLLVSGIGVAGGRATTTAASPEGESAITIAGFAFDASTIEVAVGTTVTWTNADSAAHTIRDSKDTFPESADLAQGDTFEATYETAGSFSYVCGIHPEMRGTVTVA